MSKWDNSEVKVKKASNVWRTGKVDTITFKFVPELAARVQAFEANQVDIIFQLVADSRAKIEAANGKLQLSPRYSR